MEILKIVEEHLSELFFFETADREESGLYLDMVGQKGKYLLISSNNMVMDGQQMDSHKGLQLAKELVQSPAFKNYSIRLVGS